MEISRQFLWRTIAAAFLLVTVIMFPMSSWAIDLPNSQSGEQAAMLVGQKAKAPIPLSLRPAPNQPNVGYGADGESVTVLEQLASLLPEADGSTAWNHIRLNHKPYTEGWVQGKFLMIEASDSQK